MSTDSVDAIDTDAAVILPLDDEEHEAFVAELYAGATPPGVHWYTTWKEAQSYKEPAVGARPVGRLKAGHNYFYSQRKFSEKAQDGAYWSFWWALTDDDSRNKKVWVSCIYVKGGANNQPVKGLPIN
jgi:hypothetical protein